MVKTFKKKKFNRVPSEFFSLSNSTNHFLKYILDREKIRFFEKFRKSRLFPTFYIFINFLRI
jgi:hypothetical protein